MAARDRTTENRTICDLRNAFWKLVEGRPCAELTLSELLKRSMVSSSTFYRYYKNKAAFLDSLCADLLAPYSTFAEQWVPDAAHSGLALKQMLQYTQDTLHRLQKLAESRGQEHFFQELFEQLSAGLSTAMPSPSQIQVDLIAGYFYIPLKHYIGGGTPVTLAEYQMIAEKAFQALQQQ